MLALFSRQVSEAVPLASAMAFCWQDKAEVAREIIITFTTTRKVTEEEVVKSKSSMLHHLRAMRTVLTQEVTDTVYLMPDKLGMTSASSDRGWLELPCIDYAQNNIVLFLLCEEGLLMIFYSIYIASPLSLQRLGCVTRHQFAKSLPRIFVDARMMS